jgi:hypothetical protein
MATRKQQPAEGIDLLKPKTKPMAVEDLIAQDLIAVAFALVGATSKEAYDMADKMVEESRRRYD